MNVRDVVIVGGGPAGVVTAMTAKKLYPEKSVTLIRREERPVIPCAIPYIFHTLGDVERNLMGDAGLRNLGVEIVVGEVVDVEREKQEVQLADGEIYRYDRLVLATGSVPVRPPIKNIDLSGIYFVRKDMNYLRELLEDVRKSERIVIVGGGFIGVEFADEIVKMGKKVTIVEALSHCLSLAFDKELCVKAEEILRNMGIEIRTDSLVTEFQGDERVEKVMLKNGEVIEADLVIVAIGARPNTELARKCGLKTGERGGIAVDVYMRTSDPNIFAVGDCTEKMDYFTRKVSGTMLASTASSQARVVGANLYGIKIIRQSRGTVGIFSTSIGGTVFGVAGLTESKAKEEGFDYAVGRAKGVDRHPGSLPGAHKVEIKLIVSRDTLTLLGAEVVGGVSAGEIINILGVAVQAGITAYEIHNLQIGTHPLLTSAPTVYPIIVAAEDAILNALQSS